MANDSKPASGSFSRADRESCVPVIDKMMEYACLAREKGTDALKEKARQESSVFLKNAFVLIVNGVNPELVKDVLSVMISSVGYTGSALLERMIMSEGALSIQAGDDPRIIKIKLACLLGEDFLAKVLEEN